MYFVYFGSGIKKLRWCILRENKLFLEGSAYTKTTKNKHFAYGECEIKCLFQKTNILGKMFVFETFFRNLILQPIINVFYHNVGCGH